MKELFEGTLGAREQKLSAGIDRRKRLGNSGAKPPEEQRYAIPGGRPQQPSRADAGSEQAKRRLCDQIRGTDIEAWLAAADPQNLWFNTAVGQEFQRRGWGLKWLRERMANERLASIGKEATP
ncbi:hypothetical protein ACFSOZ_07220 [Mesorhizobium newzealandense]|uniref:Uncharacterized protein n=1 Tax=Mesorhizobium newzealandense TaxID=1300302 RepID=A0ABW4U9Y3_9HYPH